MSDGGTWAGEPSKPSDGSVWADYGQDELGGDPMAKCIFNAHKEKANEGSDKTYDTAGSKKRDAEALLKKGNCDESYYGRQYCADWKKTFQLLNLSNQAFSYEWRFSAFGRSALPWS